MKSWILSGAAVAALATAAAPAFALTAEEAWTAWQDYAARGGQTITAGSEETGSGTLTASDVAFAMDSEGFSLSGGIGELVFTENGDDTVTITMSDSYTMLVEVDVEDEDPVSVALDVAMPGVEMTASDGEDGAEFSYSAPETVITVTELMVEEEEIEVDVAVTLTDFTGAYAAQGDDGMSTDLAIGSASLTAAVAEPDGPGQFNMSLNVADLKSNSSGAGLMAIDPSELAEMLENGMSAAGSATFGSTDLSVDLTGPDSFTLDASMTGGETSFSLDAGAVDTSSTYNGFAFTASGSEIPFPQVTGAMGELTTGFQLPLQATDGAEPFGLVVRLVDVTMGEEIWSMIDPAGGLGRDPATAIVDLSGAAKMFVSLLDEEAMMSPNPPGELESVTLNQLLLRLSGAELTGEGAVSFDNANPTPMGVGAPDGTINLSLTGGNALLDKLVAMGLLPEDQSMMVRMMTGMLAKPGPTADSLVSEITIQPDGTILANGAPLPF